MRSRLAPGPGVAQTPVRYPRTARLRRERAESRNDHALSARQRLANRGEHRIERAVGCDRDREAWVATREASSDLFMGRVLGTRASPMVAADSRTRPKTPRPAREGVPLRAPASREDGKQGSDHCARRPLPKCPTLDGSARSLRPSRQSAASPARRAKPPSRHAPPRWRPGSVEAVNCPESFPHGNSVASHESAVRAAGE